jgi:hypothetical protein
MLCVTQLALQKQQILTYIEQWTGSMFSSDCLRTCSFIYHYSFSSDCVSGLRMVAVCFNHLACFFTITRPWWKAHTGTSPLHSLNLFLHWPGGYNSWQGELYLGGASWRGWNYSRVQSTEYSANKFVRLWSITKLLESSASKLLLNFHHFMVLAHIVDRCVSQCSFEAEEPFLIEQIS